MTIRCAVCYADSSSVINSSVSQQCMRPTDDHDHEREQIASLERPSRSMLSRPQSVVRRASTAPASESQPLSSSISGVYRMLTAQR